MGEELTKERREPESNNAEATEIETLKSWITQKEEEVGKEKVPVRQLKSIANELELATNGIERKFKEQKGRVEESEDKKMKLELELQQIGQASAADSSEVQDLQLKGIMSQLTKDTLEKLYWVKTEEKEVLSKLHTLALDT